MKVWNHDKLTEKMVKCKLRQTHSPVSVLHNQHCFLLFSSLFATRMIFLEFNCLDVTLNEMFYLTHYYSIFNFQYSFIPFIFWDLCIQILLYFLTSEENQLTRWLYIMQDCTMMLGTISVLAFIFLLKFINYTNEVHIFFS